MRRATAASRAGVKLQVSGPPGVDGPAEVELLQDFGRTAVDGTAPLQGSGVTTYVGNDNGVNFADAATDGRPLPEGWVDSGALLVTQANVAEVIARQESGEARDKWFAPRLDEFFSDLGAHTRPLGEAS